MEEWGWDALLIGRGKKGIGGVSSVKTLDGAMELHFQMSKSIRSRVRV